MQVRADSSVSVCCLNSDHAKKPNGETIYLYKDDPSEVFHSEYFQNLRQVFEGDQWPKSCDRCRQHETMGVQSRRREEHKNHPTWVRKYQRGILPTHPVVLDLNLSNLCNLKCRICGPHSSSKWIQEYLDLFGQDHLIRGNAELQEMTAEASRDILSNWSDYNPGFFEKIDQWLPQVELMDFFGGEPLLNKKQFALVQRAADLGYAKNMTLRYVTNCTVFPEHMALHVWPKFKALHLNMSIDGLGKQFEYQRYGASWPKVLDNIKKYKEVIPEYDLRINISLSIFSILSVHEVLEFAEKEKIGISFNYVHYPERFDIRSLPLALKQKVAEKLQAGLPNRWKENAEYVTQAIAFLLSEDHSANWKYFIESVWFHDKYRKQSFAEIFPELYDLAKEAGYWFDYETEYDKYFAP